MAEVEFRPIIPADIAYIKSTFLRSHRNSAFTKLIPNKEYFDFFSPLFDSILEEDNIIAALAVNPEDSNHIYGWCAWEKIGPIQVLHYTYTKVAYRNFGIALQLLDATGFNVEQPFFYTFASGASSKLRKKFKQAVYNPFINLTAKER